jgi:hypothetical protein
MFNYDKIKFSLSGETRHVWIKAEVGHNTPFARYLSFLFLEDEWQKFQDSFYSGSFTDICHRLEVNGDYCLYYDIEMPRNNHGTMEVKYQKFYMPQQVRKIVYRYLRYNLYVWQKYCDSDRKDENVYLVLSPNRYRLLCKRYGQGKGVVKVKMSPETKERLVRHIREDNRAKRWKHEHRLSLSTIAGLVRGAKNSTYKFNDIAEFALFADPKDDKYYSFAYYNPTGKRLSYGAVVNHGTPEKPDWSYHT